MALLPALQSTSTRQAWFSSSLLSSLRPLLSSYSEVFFLRSEALGLVLLVASFIHPTVGLCGLISVLTAYGFARFLGYKDQFVGASCYTYNALLVGFGIGHLFAFNGVTLLFLCVASLMTVVLTIVLTHVFYTLFRLPALSIPFSLVGILVHLSAAHFSNLEVNTLYEGFDSAAIASLPEWLNAYLASLGAVFFIPSAYMGMIIAGLILVKSRLLFLTGVIGFLWGSAVQGVFMGSWSVAMQDPACFNYTLIAMGLGAVFNIPCWRSYLIAAVGIAMAAIFISAATVFWGQSGIPVFTLPFTVVTLTMIYLLGLVKFPLRPALFKATPEETLDHFWTTRNRYPDTHAVINLPFAGQWHVWQGFDGAWTHQGPWRHAYDFVITDQNGETYSGAGDSLSDYYCFNQPVYSPVRGRIHSLVDHLVDNPVGSPDTLNNWGNWVIIEDPRGFFVEISHFRQLGIEVRHGDWVEVGQLLGYCGNSGYSPQPHLHIQVQESPWLGAATMPFTFANYLLGSQYNSFGLPPEKTTVEQVKFLPFYDQATTFLVDSNQHYQIFKDGAYVGEWSLVTGMASDTTPYLKSADGILYFCKYAGEFRILHVEGCDPYLNMIYLAAPLIPMFYTPGQYWSSDLTNASVLHPMASVIANLANSLDGGMMVSRGEYQFISDTEIEGVVSCKQWPVQHRTYVKLDAYSGLSVIRCNQYELRKVT